MPLPAAVERDTPGFSTLRSIAATKAPPRALAGASIAGAKSQRTEVEWARNAGKSSKNRGKAASFATLPRDHRLGRELTSGKGAPAPVVAPRTQHRHVATQHQRAAQDRRQYNRL